MEKSNDLVENRTRNLPAYNIVPQSNYQIASAEEQKVNEKQDEGTGRGEEEDKARNNSAKLKEMYCRRWGRRLEERGRRRYGKSKESKL
jgi:hypothetical protein